MQKFLICFLLSSSYVLVGSLTTNDSSQFDCLQRRTVNHLPKKAINLIYGLNGKKDTHSCYRNSIEKLKSYDYNPAEIEEILNKLTVELSADSLMSFERAMNDILRLIAINREQVAVSLSGVDLYRKVPLKRVLRGISEYVESERRINILKVSGNFWRK